MAVKIGINGFGRIGRQVFRIICSADDLEVVAVNDLTDEKTLGYLLKYDSVHGKFPGSVEAGEGRLIVNGKTVKVLSVKEPAQLPWKDLGVQIVVESTGAFRNIEDLEKHISAGAEKVLLTVPPKKDPDGKIKLIVVGVNCDELTPEMKFISNASCTTNCLAPVAKVLNDVFGLKGGLMTTVHSYTNDQNILDLPHKDLRRARAAAVNIIPTTTGAAKAVGEVIPDMKGKLDGLAMRVPTPNVSLVDLVAELQTKASIEEINSSVREASQDRYKGIVLYTEKELVSVDYQSSPYSAIFDAPITYVVDGMLAKVMAWYDNESGYTERLLDLACYIGKEI